MTIQEQIERRSHVRLNGDLTGQVDSLEKEWGLRTRTEVIKNLLQEHYDRLEHFATATYDKVMVETKEVPVVICGLARSGKSTTLREGVLRRCLVERIPFMLIDTVVEHGSLSPEAQTVNMGEVMGMKFTGQASVRVVFNSRPEVMREEMRLLFSFLNGVKLEGKLKRYVVAIEESHRFDDLDPVYDFVAEAGKYVRKCIAVASNPDVWKNIAIPLRADPEVLAAFLKERGIAR